MKNKKIMIKMLFFVLVVLLTQSCDILFRCDDDDLTISRVNTDNNRLNLEGYYYGDLSGINPDRCNVYLFYQNGIFSNENSFDLLDAKSGNIKLDYPDLKHHLCKGDLGVYNILGDDIEIEYWESRTCGGVGLSYLKGIILNDTTFKITYFKCTFGGGIEREGYIDVIFRFQEYFPKPSSENYFIK